MKASTCPKCGSDKSRVRNTRRKTCGIVRYRVCLNCGRVRRTVETQG